VTTIFVSVLISAPFCPTNSVGIERLLSLQRLPSAVNAE
jgi:hypothetical protein